MTRRKRAKPSQRSAKKAHRSPDHDAPPDPHRVSEERRRTDLPPAKTDAPTRRGLPRDNVEEVPTVGPM